MPEASLPPSPSTGLRRQSPPPPPLQALSILCEQLCPVQLAEDLRGGSIYRQESLGLSREGDKELSSQDDTQAMRP